MPPGQPFARVAQLIGTAAVLAAAIACGGGTSVTELSGGPDGVRCQVGLTAEPRVVPADGGTVNVNVDAARDCTWNASTEAPWAALSTTSGQGAATIVVTIAATQQPTVRTAPIVVNNQRVDLSQEARPCRFTLAASSAEIGPAGGSVSVAVATVSGCTWRASSAAGWIRVGSDARNGSATVVMEVDPNTGVAREGAVTIAEQTFTIVQRAVGAPNVPICTAVVQPSTYDVAAAATTETVRLETGPTCDWTAASDVSWIVIAPPASGRGNATVRLAIAQNGGAARTGTVTIARQLVSVRQAAAVVAPPACTYSIDPASLSFPSTGGPGRVQVTASRNDCVWTAASNAAWAVVATDRGTGTGELQYTVQPNAVAAARSTTIVIGGRSHTVTQAGAAPSCSYSLNPPTQTIGAGGGESRFAVVTQAGCAWDTSGGAPWITVTTGVGNGPGDVVFTAQPNGGAERAATFVVAGQSHVVTQSAAAPTCTYALNPTTLSMSAAGGEARFNVSTQPGCSWSASENAEWLTLTAGSGTGSGEVLYTAQANGSPDARVATITVAGQSHTLTQAGTPPPCTYSVNPTSQNIPASGGEGRFSVATQPGCAWSVTGAPSWVSMTVAAATGSGEAVYTVQANDATEPRTATLTVTGGQSHSVMQAAGSPPPPPPPPPTTP